MLLPMRTNGGDVPRERRSRNAFSLMPRNAAVSADDHVRGVFTAHPVHYRLLQW